MKTLVTYFSAQGTTAKVAKNLQEAINADILEIKPEIPYEKKDLNWLNPLSRSTKEMKNKQSRPAILCSKCDIQQYDVIFVGFPIWWYIAPTIVNTFLEQYDFSNKKIVLFATSGGSGFGDTVKYLKPSVSESTTLVEGAVLNRKSTVEDLKEWAKNYLD